MAHRERRERRCQWRWQRERGPQPGTTLVQHLGWIGSELTQVEAPSTGATGVGAGASDQTYELSGETGSGTSDQVAVTVGSAGASLSPQPAQSVTTASQLVTVTSSVTVTVLPAGCSGL